MPLYVFTCSACGESEDIRLEVEERDKPQRCSICGEEMSRRIAPVFTKFIGKGWSRNETSVRDNLNPDKHTKQYYS